MRVISSILGCFLFVQISFAQSFNITIERLSIQNGLVIGKIYANGKYLGHCYENEVLRVKKGKYNGNVRYYSGKKFVSSPYGTLAKEGDFLLEVGDVSNRSNILFHTGKKPYHSRGCILLGAPIYDSGSKYLPIDHPLRKLRKLFYGTETPSGSPALTIQINFDESKLKNENSPVNSSLILLIDISGSMKGNKIESAKRSAIETIKKALKSGSTEVAILAFEGDCSNPIHSATGFSTDAKVLEETVKRLQTKGGTPLASALKVANTYLERNKSFQSKSQMIILLADGDDNCGNIKSILNGLKKKEIVFRHETIGLELGSNADAKNQLELIAKETGGDYHNASSHKDLSKKFENALENMKLLEMLGKMKKTEEKKVEKKSTESDINWNILDND